MGLSSLPTPPEGVLCVLLFNTALSISVVKGVVRSLLHIVGIGLSPSPASPSSSPSADYAEDGIEVPEPQLPSGELQDSIIRKAATRIDQLRDCEWKEHECTVCLVAFELHAEISHLACGHLFHTECLEKWLDYWNVTCPLCRSPMIDPSDLP